MAEGNLGIAQEAKRNPTSKPFPLGKTRAT